MYSVSTDRTARIWDVATGKVQRTISLGDATSVAFSSDRTHIALSGLDYMPHIYPLGNNELLALARRQVTRTLTPNECEIYLHTESCPNPQ